VKLNFIIWTIDGQGLSAEEFTQYIDNAIDSANDENTISQEDIEKKYLKHEKTAR